MKNTIKAVCKLNAEWPEGRVMGVAPHGHEIRFGEFVKCVDMLTGDKTAHAAWLASKYKEYNACCSCCNHEWMCTSDLVETMACPGCGDKPEKRKDAADLIYTQEMFDAGELLVVGMRFKHEEKEVKALAISKEGGGSVLFQTGDGSIDCCLHDKAWVKPITLIDGKAYQFEARGKTLMGIYDTSEETLNIHQSYYFNLEACTNIKLLGVIS